MSRTATSLKIFSAYQNALENSFRFAMVQMKVGTIKTENLSHAVDLIRMAASQNAQIVALPECFNSPYGTQHFREYAESIPNGPTTKALSDIAKECKIYLISGSIPEAGEHGRLYNTCTIFDPAGNMIGKHRKVHLFDIDVPGKISFQESKVLSAGDSITTFSTPWGRIGVGICYDIRFPELAMLMSRQQDCKFLVYPGAFNTVTGPLHWELLTRARAVDCQVFVAVVSPARGDDPKGYLAWGHSCLSNPWGEILIKCSHDESLAVCDVDVNMVHDFRQSIPTSVQRREDIYCLSSSE